MPSSLLEYFYKLAKFQTCVIKDMNFIIVVVSFFFFYHVSCFGWVSIKINLLSFAHALYELNCDLQIMIIVFFINFTTSYVMGWFD